MDQQDFPILLHMSEQPLPVDPLGLPQNEMGNVGTVVAMPVLQQRLRPDHLGRRRELDRHVIELRRVAFLEPMVGDADHRGGGTEDHVEEAVAASHLGDPTLVLDLGLESTLLEVKEDAREVARLAEHV